MTSAASHQPPTNGALAVMRAFMAALIAMLRGPAHRKQLQRQLLSYEVRLIIGIFRGDIRLDPEFMARPRKERLASLKRFGRTIEKLRSQRIQYSRACSLLGRGLVKHPAIMMAIRFAHRFVQRPLRQLSSARLTFVAPTREQLAGAPP